MTSTTISAKTSTVVENPAVIPKSETVQAPTPLVEGDEQVFVTDLSGAVRVTLTVMPDESMAVSPKGPFKMYRRSNCWLSENKTGVFKMSRSDAGRGRVTE